VLDWKSLNRDLFGALLLQQTLLFVELDLIVAVAAGTVVSSLVVLLTEKTRSLGVLAALGAPPRVASRVLRAAGVFLGGAGLLLGTGIGLVVCAVLTKTHAVRFPPEIAGLILVDAVPSAAARRGRDPRHRLPPRARVGAAGAGAAASGRRSAVQ
jgi:ABC-type lipoprotein release transport system permease subunit